MLEQATYEQFTELSKGVSEWISDFVMYSENGESWKSTKTILMGLANYGDCSQFWFGWHPRIIKALPFGSLFECRSMKANGPTYYYTSSHEAATALVSSICWYVFNEKNPIKSTGVFDKDIMELERRISDSVDVLTERLHEAGRACSLAELTRITSQMQVERVYLADSPVKESTAEPQVVLTPILKQIWDALHGKAMSVDQLAAEVTGGETTRLYRAGLKTKLEAEGKVKHIPTVGWYRPDAPPKNITIT